MTNESTNHTPLRLGVNVDHVATLRQARGTRYPDVAKAAHAAMAAGADSITVHLREDRRHIQDADVEALTGARGVPVNLEMALTRQMLAIATRLKPRDACLVPERRAELTTEGGLDVVGQTQAVRDGLSRLHDAGINAALFIDPDIAQIDAAAEAGARVIELHTGAYADAPDAARRDSQLERIRRAGAHAHARGIEIHAGHGLTTDNVGPIAALDTIVELNIGHALIADAVFTGIARAVQDMRAAMDSGRRTPR